MNQAFNAGQQLNKSAERGNAHNLALHNGASAQALGWPPKIANNFAKLAPGHAVDYGFLVLGAAGIATLVWLLTWGLRRASWRASLRWAAGVTLIWVLTTTLWLSWIDHGISYRPVVLALRQALPPP